MGRAFNRLLLPILLGTALTIGFAACQSERDEAFAFYLQGREANTTITLEEWEELFGKAGDLKADPTLSFVLTNHGSKRVMLPDDFGTRIFVYFADSQSWSEIRDGTTYSPAGVPQVLEPASEPPFNQEIVDPWPVGEGLDKASHLRVMVSGDVLGDDGELGDEVVAYVEIELRR